MTRKKPKPYKIAPDEPKVRAKARPARHVTRSGAPNPPRFRAVRPLLLTALAMGLLGGGVAGVGVLEDRASAYRAGSGPTVEFAWPTFQDAETGERRHTIPAELRTRILDESQRALGERVSPFDPEPLDRLGRMLSDSGWFEGSPTIRRGPDGIFRVQGRWRAHVAGVRFRAQDFLVTADARMMPVIYSPEQRQPALRVVMNPRFEPPRTSTGAFDYNRAWEGDDVRAGLELLEVLRQQPYWHQVAAVDLSRFERERILVIVTDRGSRIEWGAPVNEFAPGQLPSKRRLDYLETFFSTRGIGHIDQGLASYSLWDMTRQVEVPASSLNPARR